MIFPYIKNGSVDCFHHLCDDTFEIQGVTDSKPQEQRDNAAQTLLEIYQCKFQTALSGNEKSMTVMYMLCVYHRFLLAICEATSIIDSDDPSAITLLVLDLKSNKLTRIDTNLPVDSENRNDYESRFIWVDSGEVFDGFNLNHIFYLAKDILYEISLNLESRQCSIAHEVMLFPSVELLDCKFDGTEVVLSAAKEKELKSIEAEKKKILDSWKENVIVSPDKE